VKCYCSLQNSARKWNWPTARSREIYSALLAGKRPKAEKRSTGPLALGASRAPGRNLGLGQESFIPPGLILGPVSVSRPSQSDGCARFPAEQNRAPTPSRNPSLIQFFLRSLSRAAAATPSVRAAPERARPRRRPSPSPVCALTVG
jgi:hypothetical protein